MVFNKADLLSEDQAASLRVTYPDCLIVSSLSGDGLDTLRICTGYRICKIHVLHDFRAAEFRYLDCFHETTL